MVVKKHLSIVSEISDWRDQEAIPQSETGTVTCDKNSALSKSQLKNAKERSKLSGKTFGVIYGGPFSS